MQNSLAQQMVAIVAIAAIAGLAFNTLSPLGVRVSRGSSAPATASAQPTPGEQPLYRNETERIQFVPKVADVRQGTSRVESQSIPAGSAEEQPWVTWAQVKQLQAAGPLLFVDARNPGAYEAGHIPGAVSLPLTAKAALLEEFAAKHPKDQALVIYCASQSCPVSEQLASVLATRFGFKNLRILNGGYAEYLAAEGNP